MWGAEETKSQKDGSANALMPMDNHTAFPCHLSVPGHGKTSAYILCAGRLRSKACLPESPDPQDGSGQGLGRKYLDSCSSNFLHLQLKQVKSWVATPPPRQAAVIECLMRGGEGRRGGQEKK